MTNIEISEIISVKLQEMTLIASVKKVAKKVLEL